MAAWPGQSPTPRRLSQAAPHLSPHCWTQPVKCAVTFLMPSSPPRQQLSSRGSRAWSSPQAPASPSWLRASASARISSTSPTSSAGCTRSTSSSRRFCSRTRSVSPAWDSRARPPHPPGRGHPKPACGVRWSLPCQIRGTWMQAQRKSREAEGSNLEEVGRPDPAGGVTPGGGRRMGPARCPLSAGTPAGGRGCGPPARPRPALPAPAPHLQPRGTDNSPYCDWRTGHRPPRAGPPGPESLLLRGRGWCWARLQGSSALGGCTRHSGASQSLWWRGRSLSGGGLTSVPGPCPAGGGHTGAGWTSWTGV